VLGGRLQRALPVDQPDSGQDPYKRIYYLATLAPISPSQTPKEHSQLVRSSYLKTVERLRSAGHKIVLIYPIPEVGFQLPDRLKSQLRGRYEDAERVVANEPILTNHEEYVRRSRAAFALLDSIPGDDVVRVYPDRIFCNHLEQDRCATHDTKSLFYRDSQHLSYSGAEKLLDVVFRAIDG